MSKVIILRGNSGSGKSSVAREIQARIQPHPVLVEHDHFRRKILKEKESSDIINDQLVFKVVEFALEHNKDVLIEGILPFQHSHQKYKDLFDKIFSIHPTENYIYYFDIPFEETLQRHTTKPNSHEFGEAEMRRWYKEDDRSGYPSEIIIDSSNSFEETVAQIITQTDLLEKET